MKKKLSTLTTKKINFNKLYNVFKHYKLEQNNNINRNHHTNRKIIFFKFLKKIKNKTINLHNHYYNYIKINFHILNINTYLLLTYYRKITNIKKNFTNNLKIQNLLNNAIIQKILNIQSKKKLKKLIKIISYFKSKKKYSFLDYYYYITKNKKNFNTIKIVLHIHEISL